MPAQLVHLASKLGLAALAITDHDSLEGVPDAMRAGAETGVLVLPGVEINTDVPGAEVHILGYCVDFRDQGILDALSRARKERVERGRKMVARLAQLGVRVDWRRVQELAGEGAIGRPHVAQAILEAGYVASLGEAFDRYIGRNGPAYVDRDKTTPEEAVRLITGSGGFAVLAHPHSFGLGRLDSLLDSLMPAGLAGVEAYYGGYGPYDADRLVSQAEARGLVVSGGSDYHGLGGDSETPLGGMDIPEKRVERFLSLARQHAPQLFKSWSLTVSL